MSKYDINIKKRGDGWRVIVQEMNSEGDCVRAYVSPPGQELDTYQQAQKWGRYMRDEWMKTGLA